MQEFSDQMPSDIERFPMVPIRDVVIFPYTKVAFKIGRPSSVRALEEAMTGERDIFLATQHDATVDEPSADQIYHGRHAWAGFCRHSGRTTARSRSSSRAANAADRFASNRMLTACSTHTSARSPRRDESGYRTDGLLQKIHTLGRAIPASFAGCIHRCFARESARHFGRSDRGFDVVASPHRRRGKTGPA